MAHRATAALAMIGDNRDGIDPHSNESLTLMPQLFSEKTIDDELCNRVRLSSIGAWQGAVATTSDERAVPVLAYFRPGPECAR